MRNVSVADISEPGAQGYKATRLQSYQAANVYNTNAIVIALFFCSCANSCPRTIILCLVHVYPSLAGLVYGKGKLHLLDILCCNGCRKSHDKQDYC